ncbi:hypothetical protein SAMN04487951_10629 [Vreelandella arcis]|uniref:Uncharacterized protein n=1 Tax=Vreelandella arcis TaxID=416873 RepID=A0A1H0CEM9_9GAMM|nr:hypothetical protein SAMN04487951_10629 [Halomonas arcis]
MSLNSLTNLLCHREIVFLGLPVLVEACDSLVSRIQNKRFAGRGK